MLEQVSLNPHHPLDNDDWEDERDPLEEMGEVVRICAMGVKSTDVHFVGEQLRAVLFRDGIAFEPTLDWAVTLVGVYCNQIPDAPAEALNTASKIAALYLFEPVFSRGFVDLATSMLRIVFKLDKPLITASIYGYLISDTETLNPKAVHYIAQSLMHTAVRGSQNQRVVLRSLGALCTLCHNSGAYHHVIDTCDLRFDLYDTFYSTLLKSGSNALSRSQCVIGLGCCNMPSEDLTTTLRVYTDYRTEPCPKVRTCALDALAALSIARREPDVSTCMLVIEPMLQCAKFDPDEDVGNYAAEKIQEHLFANMNEPAHWELILTSAKLFPSMLCTEKILLNNYTQRLVMCMQRHLQSNATDVGLWTLIHGFVKNLPTCLGSLKSRIPKAIPLLFNDAECLLWCCKSISLLPDITIPLNSVYDLLNPTNLTKLTPSTTRAVVQLLASRENEHNLIHMAKQFYARLPGSLETMQSRNELSALCCLLHYITNADVSVVKDVCLLLLMFIFKLPEKSVSQTTVRILTSWRRTLPQDSWGCMSECLLDVIRTHFRTVQNLVTKAATTQYLFMEPLAPEGMSQRLVALDTLHDLTLILDHAPLADSLFYVIKNSFKFTSNEVLCALEALTHLAQEGSCRLGSQMFAPLLCLIGAHHMGIKQRAYDMVHRLMTTSDKYLVLNHLLQAVFVLNCFKHSIYTGEVVFFSSVTEAQRGFIYKNFLKHMHRKNSEAVTKMLEVVVELLSNPPMDSEDAHGFWSVVNDLLDLCNTLGMRHNHPLYVAASSFLTSCPCDVPSSIWTRLQTRPGGPLNVVDENSNQEPRRKMSAASKVAMKDRTNRVDPTLDFFF